MIGVFGRGAATALLALSCSILCAGVARADSSYDAGPAPVLRVNLDSGNVLVQTADSPNISVQAGAGVNVIHLPAARLPAEIPIPELNAQSAAGPVTLPRETFVLPQIGGEHEVIVVRGSGDATIDVPRGTAVVFARVRDGRVIIANYSGVFVAHSRNGGVFLEHVSGTGFAQSIHGPVDASDSSFTRLRARTATGDMLFRDCTSNQIEASSTYGSIVYDNGQFQPGLARFESQYGNVAIGVQNQGNGVQIGAHSGSGHIVSNFGDGTQVSGSDANTQAVVRGGGPVVTTSSQNGSVYLYNGSMSAHPAVEQDMQSSSGAMSSAARAGATSAAARGGALQAAPRSGAGGQRVQSAPLYQRAPLTAPRQQPQYGHPAPQPHAPPHAQGQPPQHRYSQQPPHRNTPPF